MLSSEGDAEEDGGEPEVSSRERVLKDSLAGEAKVVELRERRENARAGGCETLTSRDRTVSVAHRRARVRTHEWNQQRLR